MMSYWFTTLNMDIFNTAQKMKFSIKEFFSKCDQIRRKLRIWSHLLKKSLMENFIFCAVWKIWLLLYKGWVKLNRRMKIFKKLKHKGSQNKTQLKVRSFLVIMHLFFILTEIPIPLYLRKGQEESYLIYTFILMIIFILMTCKYNLVNSSKERDRNN